MSGEPKRGMVAGQPIQTGNLTKDYEDGFARTFGERKPQRGRFVYSAELGRCVEVGAEWVDPTADAGGRRSDEEVHGGTVTTGGDDISSRTKRRDWMKATGSADASDYSEGFRAKVKADRERTSERAADKAVVEAITQVKERRRRR